MILSVDLGTSKLCAAAVDPHTGRALAVRSCANDSQLQGLPPDLHEQDPVRTRDLCLDLIRQVLAADEVAGRSVEAVGFSGQMHGVMLVDKSLRPLTSLITWRDRRTAREDSPGGVADSLRLLGPDVEARAGCRLAVGYGAATLRWLDANGLLPAGSTALTIAGYLAAVLTGIPAIDETHAASWGVFDLTGGGWDRHATHSLNLPVEVLPNIRPSAVPLSELSRDAARTLGIGGRPVVCSPVGDAQASIIGAAGFASDTIVLNLGTGGQISIPRPDYAFTEELDAWPMPFGGYAQVGATLCGGWSYAYLRRFFQDIARDICGVELSDEVVYERMNALAASAEPGTGGLRVDTRFSGARRDKSIRGSVVGIDTSNLTPANLALGVVEGIVRDLRSMWLTSDRRDVRRLLASGNGVRKNPVIRSVIRAAFEMACFMSSAPEEAVRGAAYAAAVGAGLVSRDDINHHTSRLAEPC